MGCITGMKIWSPFEDGSEYDKSHEIGAIPVEQHSSVCFIESDNNSTLHFRCEIPVTVSLMRREVVPYEPFYRFEVRVASSKKVITKGCNLFLTLFPYSTKWVHFTLFKSSNRHNKMLPAYIKTKQELSQFIDDEAEFDLWETGKNLIAGISKPFRSFNENVRNTHMNAEYILCVCTEKRESVEKKMYSSEKIGKLLTLTEQNKIQFIPQNVLAQNNISDIRLSDEVIQNSDSLMCIAIRQALAGPRTSFEKWVNRPVEDLVDVIYRQLLHFENRTYFREMEAIDVGLPDNLV